MKKDFFADRSVWVTHMQKFHTGQWVCASPAHEPLFCQNEKQFEAHLLGEHTGTFTEDQLPILIARAKVMNHIQNASKS